MKSKRGGTRAGAGRPKGSGKYGEQTLSVRVPGSLLPEVQGLLEQKKMSEQGSMRTVPFYTNRIAAGIPQCSDDHVDCYVDFNDYLRPDPSRIFCIRVLDESMEGAGIHEGDLLIADRSVTASHRSIVVVDWKGSLLIRRLSIGLNAIELVAEHLKYEAVVLELKTELKILGVGIRVIHSLS